ncbi:MAG: pilus assembly protein PilM, partial [Burkholderiales bacterium]|nr:pilus assembly protein PilM [Burkholderiales bacterium]
MLATPLKERLAASLDFLKPKAPPLIGLDISSSAIKLVEIDATGRGLYRIERYVIESLPKEAVVDGNIANFDVVSEALRACWKRSGTRIKNVALSLPAAAVITKKVILPGNQRDEDMELQVQSEANQYIPFTLEEVNLDFQVLGLAPNSPEDVEVLIAASRKEKIEDRLALAQSAGLKPLVVDVDSFAAQSAFELIQGQLPASNGNPVYAIVDAGATVLRITLFNKGNAIYVREQQLGGNQLTQEICGHYGMSHEEAEAAKRNGNLPENYYSEILQPFIEKIALEASRALQFFYTSTQFNRVDHIVLAGGCALLAGLEERVAAQTQTHTIIANPFSNMALSQRIKPRQLTQDAPALMVA